MIAGFTVTVLSRSPASLKDLPSGVKTAQVDYSSVDNLAKALTGQDVVISTVGMPGVSSQKIVIDASIQAGVKRYIPSDWGGLSTDEKTSSLGLYGAMQNIQKYLKEKASNGEIKYTIFAVGSFLEYVISMPFFVDAHKHTVNLYDNGVHSFRVTSVESIGKAVTGALKNAPSTANRLIRVHDIALTQGRILALAKKYSEPDTEWHETHVDASAEIERLTKTIEGSASVATWFGLLKAAILSGKYQADYTPSDNDLVGLPLMSEDEFEKAYAEGFQRILYDFDAEVNERFEGHSI